MATTSARNATSSDPLAVLLAPGTGTFNNTLTGISTCSLREEHRFG